MIDAENESPAGCGKHLAGQLPIKPDELKTVHRTAAGLFSFYARGPPTVNRLMTKPRGGSHPREALRGPVAKWLRQIPCKDLSRVRAPPGPPTFGQNCAGVVELADTAVFKTDAR